MALVLVTGGSGFIGHHLVEALRARGQRVRVLDVRPPAAANTDVDYVHGSVLDGPTTPVVPTQAAPPDEER